MFKSKHSGWTWDLKRTPFGGGGSWTNQVMNDFSSVLGTDGGGGGIIGNTENIINSAKSGNPLDVTSAILGTDGSGLGLSGALAQTDNSVHTLVPGGWATVAAIAATIATAGAASETIPGAMSSEGAFMAADSANLASQGLSQAAIAQNLAASYGISATEAAQLAAASTSAYAASGAAPTGFETVATPSTSTGANVFEGYSPTGSSAGTAGTTVPSGYGAASAATQALPYTEAFDAANLAKNGSNAASIAQNLTATGMNSFLAQDMANLAAQGLSSSQIASTLAASYTPAELAGTGIESLNWSPSSGTSLADALKTANQVRQGASAANSLSKLLTQGAASGLSSSLGQLAQGANPQGQALSPWVHGNQNPFVQTAQQPIQNAKPLDIASLANLLKQG